MYDTNLSSPTNDVRKIVATMRCSPSSIRMCEAAKVLEACGYYYSRSKGSHRIYTNGTGAVYPLTGYSRKHLVRPCYIKDILDIYDETF